MKMTGEPTNAPPHAVHHHDLAGETVECIARARAQVHGALDQTVAGRSGEQLTGALFDALGSILLAEGVVLEPSDVTRESGR
jgi:hypothetical protein